MTLGNILGLSTILLTIIIAVIRFSFQFGEMQTTIKSIKERLDKIDNTELNLRLKYYPRKGD